MLDLTYSIIYSKRKTLALQVHPVKGLLVRAPIGYPKSRIEAFVEEHQNWIVKKLAKQKEVQDAVDSVVTFTPLELRELKKKAAEVLPLRLEAWAKVMGVEYKGVTIRAQKTRWGSCTTHKTINLNCLLMLTPSEVIDSVLVHELCHLKQMNHSERFYQEIYKVMPDYDKWDAWLKKNGSIIMARLPKEQ